MAMFIPEGIEAAELGAPEVEEAAEDGGKYAEDGAEDVEKDVKSHESGGGSTMQQMMMMQAMQQKQQPVVINNSNNLQTGQQQQQSGQQTEQQQQVESDDEKTLEGEQDQLSEERAAIEKLQQAANSVDPAEQPDILIRLQNYSRMYQKNIEIFNKQINQVSSLFKQSKDYKFN